MAKKGAAAALQTDVTNDEDWAKILERKGLVVADIYSEYGGPCVGMISILKKIKMEIGGDSLSYATAKCDNITSLARFKGMTEPTWMFIRDGQMVNLLFGASSPILIQTLTEELKRLETGQPPLYSIPVSESRDEEIARMKEIQEKQTAKYAEVNAKRDAARKEKYEAEMSHFVEALRKETVLILLPWLFKDEEGNKRDKKSVPAYGELAELLPEFFKIEREVMMQVEDDMLTEMQKETSFEFSKETKRMFMEDKCLVMMLKVIDKVPETDIEECLFNMLYGEPAVPQTPDDLAEECYVQRNLPPLEEYTKEIESIQNNAEKMSKLLCVTTAWVPLNPRNKALSFRVLFPKYIQANCPYEDKDATPPITVFKYDYTKMRELQAVHEVYWQEVIKYAIFESDKSPEPKKIARLFEDFELLPKEIQSKAVFVWVVKQSTTNVFLSFAGIGPIYVSETPEIAEEDAEKYFPRKSTVSEEIQVDEEEKEGGEEQTQDQAQGQQEQQPQEEQAQPQEEAAAPES